MSDIAIASTTGAAASLAAVASALVISLARRPAIARRFADIPNERSLHSQPVPRIGGVGVMAGLALAAMTGAAGEYAGLVAIALALAGLSALDDARGLPARVRFAGHAAAAIALAAFYLDAWPWWLIALALLTTVWMTNLYNFMDGSDGLAGGMAVIGFAAYAIGAAASGAVALAAVSACVAAAAAGFLVFNFPPARVFLGDAGSVPLGFLAAALGATGYAAGAWPVWFPAIVFAPFIADASVTLARRLARGERVWQAHKSHYYQRAIRLGASHRQVALGAYLLMAAVATLALVAARAAISVQLAAIIVALVLHALVFLAIDRRWARAGDGR